jgi:hypothetical protein
MRREIHVRLRIPSQRELQHKILTISRFVDMNCPGVMRPPCNRISDGETLDVKQDDSSEPNGEIIPAFSFGENAPCGGTTAT